MFIRHLTVLSVIAVALVACETGEPHGRRIERQAEDRVIGSNTLVTATDQAVSQIANEPDIRSADGRTVIVMDTVENRTSDPSADFQIYLARIRALLNQSGASKDLVFVETRGKAERIKQREGYPAEATQRTLPRYALAASFYDLPRRSGNYYLLTFQMIDLTSDLLAWEGSYEVKLQP